MTRIHGSYAKYRLDGCRCYPCAAARSAYDENRNRAIAYGTWNPWVEAEPVRAHALYLRECGIGLRRLADLTGLSRSVLIGLINGKPGRPPASRVRPETAARILAVEPTLENIASKTPVDAAGTRRRLQALVAVGWAQAQLADRLGMSPGNFGGMMRRSQVVAATARAARDLYSQLWDENPADHGVTANSISRALNQAREHGWLPPAAWDDDLLDLPDGELTAELARRAEQMDDAEVQRCHTARYKHGERSPLINAGAREHGRRQRERTRAAA